MVGTAEDLASSPPDEVEIVDPEHPIHQPVSTRPALVVLGLAVFILVIGGIASVLATTSSQARTPSSVTIAGRTVVRLTPATVAMKAIVSGGQPPADIISEMVVPSGSAIVRTLDIDQGVSQFDRKVYFTTHLAQNQVVGAYRTVLPTLGWKIIYRGPQTAGLGTEVLAKRGSGDGFYWEVGAVVSPTTSVGTTPFSVEIFELSDDDS